MNHKFPIAVCQMNSTDQIEHNYEQVLYLLDQTQAHSKKIELVCFPENSLYMRILEGEKIEGLELTDKVFSKLAEQAIRRGFNMHFGSIALKEHGNLRNASVFISKDGKVRPSYYKIHLFDIDIEGHVPVRESDVYKHGEKPQILEIDGWHFGQSICYDLRFAELYSWYASHSVEGILIPASFLVPTGKVHWEILLRARAIESQAYVIAAAQAGTHRSTKGSGERQTYGKSMVVDPWGQIVAEAGTSGAEVLVIELDLDRVRSVRRQIPMKNHRKLIKMRK